MARTQSVAMSRAVALVMTGAPHGIAPRDAADACGVALGSLYLALKRHGHIIDGSAASKRALADPAVRAKMSAASKRAWAKRVVREALLPQLRAHVNRAAVLLSEGLCVGDAAIVLANEVYDAQQTGAA